MPAEFESIKGTSTVALKRTECLHVRNRNSGCRSCAEVCPHGCISFEGNDVVFSTLSCDWCGLCVGVCPTEALVATRPTAGELYDLCRKGILPDSNKLVIVCGNMLSAAKGCYDPDTLVGLSTLGLIDESLLLRLTAEGVKELCLVGYHCETCTYGKCRERVEELIATCKTLSDTWHLDFSVTFSQKMPSACRKTGNAEYDASKRELFAHFGKEIKQDVTAEAGKALDKAMSGPLAAEQQEAQPAKAMHVNVANSLPRFEGGRRKRLLDILDAAGTPEDVLIETPLWSQVLIDTELCRACRMCATFCPTGSLFRFRTKRGLIGVKQMVRKCINCGNCESVCPTGALQRSHEVFALDVAEGRVERMVLGSEADTAGKLAFGTMHIS